MTPESHGNVFQFQNSTNTQIKKAEATKSLGIDKISIKLLQAAGDSITDSLTYRFNLSLNSGIFPGDKSDCRNYRPVSVISAVAKIFEKIVYRQFYELLTNNEILSTYQSGFCPQHSVKMALLHSTIKWLSNMDEGLINGILLTIRF